ncbi:hypothetical protein, partial [Nocardia africana]
QCCSFPNSETCAWLGVWGAFLSLPHGFWCFFASSENLHGVSRWVAACFAASVGESVGPVGGQQLAYAG